jgi:hypothetical protein
MKGRVMLDYRRATAAAALVLGMAGERSPPRPVEPS